MQAQKQSEVWSSTSSKPSSEQEDIQIMDTGMRTIINSHSDLAFAHSISRDLDKWSMSAGVAPVFKELFGNLKEKDTKPQLKVLPFTVY